MCRVLNIVNTGNAYSRLGDGELTYVRQTDVGLPGGRNVALLSESGLYKLVLRSDKADAKPFQDWVTRDVLPAIRKDGGYILGEEKVATGEMSEDELVAASVRPPQATWGTSPAPSPCLPRSASCRFLRRGQARVRRWRR